MNLGIIGCGAIGTDVAKAADKMKEIKKIYLFDKNPTAVDNLGKALKKAEIRDLDEFLEKVDVVFEGASQQAVQQYAEKILRAGKDLILMSVGSLFDDNFRKKLEKIALEKKCKIYIPSGAIFGIYGSGIIYMRKTFGQSIVGALMYSFMLLLLTSGTGVNVIAHFGGLAFGLIIGYVLAESRRDLFGIDDY